MKFIIALVFIATSACAEAIAPIHWEATPTPADTAFVSLNALASLSGPSACTSYFGLPQGFVSGTAFAFARAVCNPTRSDVVLASEANTGNTHADVLAWYSDIYAAAGMDNSKPGVDTLRHLYALMIGEASRESSGRYCCGKDPSANNTASDTSEAGAWQTSWNSHAASPELVKLFNLYKGTTHPGCFLDTFAKGVTCSTSNWKMWGTGPGVEFQTLAKTCPMFAAEYAAVTFRTIRRQYGPLNTKATKLRPECDAMLKNVQDYVQANPGVCQLLN